MRMVMIVGRFEEVALTGAVNITLNVTFFHMDH